MLEQIVVGSKLTISGIVTGIEGDSLYADLETGVLDTGDPQMQRVTLHKYHSIEVVTAKDVPIPETIIPVPAPKLSKLPSMGVAAPDKGGK